MRQILAALILMLTLSAHTGEAHFTYKGVSYVSFWNDEYLQPASGESLDALVQTGAKWASVLVTWYMPSPTSNTIAVDPMKTPQDAGVETVIRAMKARGLKVMLKPHVDVADGSWRGQIAPSNAAAWFASYNTFITKYAAMAQTEGVELFCVGCEFKTMSGGAYAANWTSVIGNIRAAYSGPLTYAANANFLGDELFTCSFWPQVDIIGADCYVPLTSSNTPTIPQLVAAWSNNSFGQNMLQAYRNFQASLNKPMIFTEIGYQSSDGTNQTPYGVPVRNLDLQEQADCYEAAFQVWDLENWLSGMFWWGWEATPIPPTDDHYSARGKPSATILRNWYGTPVTPPPPPDPPPDPPPGGTTNNAPAITSALTYAPQKIKAGDSATFTVGVTDADQDALTYQWDFGDGTTSSDAAPAKAFAAGGTYTVSVTASDGKGGSVSASIAVHVYNDMRTIADPKLAVGLDFKKINRDTVALSGKLTLPDGFSFADRTVRLDIGGVVKTLTLDAKGRGATADRHDAVSIGVKPRKGVVTFSAKFKMGSFSGDLADEGLTPTDEKNKAVTLPVALTTGDWLFEAALNARYSAKAGDKGRAK